MSQLTSEAAFYEKHHLNKMKSADNSPLNVEETLRLRSSRYWLVNEVLSDPHCRLGRQSMVEIGCADGQVLSHMVGKYTFAEAVGIDIANRLSPYASSDRLRFLEHNANQALPLPAGTVDVIMAMMVIEHLFDPFHAFREIRRVLSPTGMAFINLPLVSSVRNRMRLLFGLSPVTSVCVDKWFEDEEWDGGHLHYFTVDTIHRLATRCGLKVERYAAVGKMANLKDMYPQALASELTMALTVAELK